MINRFAGVGGLGHMGVSLFEGTCVVVVLRENYKESHLWSFWPVVPETRPTPMSHNLDGTGR